VKALKEKERGGIVLLSVKESDLGAGGKGP